MSIVTKINEKSSGETDCQLTLNGCGKFNICNVVSLDSRRYTKNNILYYMTLYLENK